MNGERAIEVMRSWANEKDRGGIDGKGEQEFLIEKQSTPTAQRRRAVSTRSHTCSLFQVRSTAIASTDHHRLRYGLGRCAVCLGSTRAQLNAHALLSGRSRIRYRACGRVLGHRTAMLRHLQGSYYARPGSSLVCSHTKDSCQSCGAHNKTYWRHFTDWMLPADPWNGVLQIPALRVLRALGEAGSVDAVLASRRAMDKDVAVRSPTRPTTQGSLTVTSMP
eukprot:3893958-Rhodomonas_salina.2